MASSPLSVVGFPKDNDTPEPGTSGDVLEDYAEFAVPYSKPGGDITCVRFRRNYLLLRANEQGGEDLEEDEDEDEEAVADDEARPSMSVVPPEYLKRKRAFVGYSASRPKAEIPQSPSREAL
ncbi:hypothetical protein BS47DRAFT_816854 [Hydnum rufescens UP504]|uniref:Uncharacterized protein n=1 Tax=Hydnum rufescens UP504 TaxID=1448309 RepID=A0A9P6DGK5_9AGAM|nr:hypothetical protein BS47DRAFT_816854 [Hydnum rufescens UP504]